MPASVASAFTAAMGATGPMKLIWFHGSARVIFATRSSVTAYVPGVAQNSRDLPALLTMRKASGSLVAIKATSPSNKGAEISLVASDSTSKLTVNRASVSVTCPA